MGGGKGGGSQELPDYSQLLQDSAFYGRTPQLTPNESVMWDADRATSARVLSPAEQMRQGLQVGLGNTALGTMLGWYGGSAADMGQFDPATGMYLPSGAAGGQPPGGGGGYPWEGGGPTPQDGKPIDWQDYDFLGQSGGGGGAGGGPSGDDWYDPYGDLAPGGLPGSGVGGPYQGLDYGDQDFLRAIMGGDYGPGGGGEGMGNYDFRSGGVSVGSPETQMLTYDAQGNPTIGSALISDLDLGSLPGLASEGDLMGARDRAEQAMFKRAMGLLEPGFDQRRDAEAEMLANRGAVQGGDIWQTYAGNTDQAYNQARSNAAWDAVSEGRNEYGFLSDQAMRERNMTLSERLQQAGLQNQTQAQMGAANLGARGQEWNELYGRGQLAAQSRASSNALNFQRWQADIANRMNAQSQLYGQQMGERGTQYSELANLLGLGSPMGMQGYWSPQGVDVMGASGQAANNQLTNYQMSPLAQILGLGGSLIGAAGTTGSGFGGLF